MSLHPEALARFQEGLALEQRGDLRAARDAYLRALELDARLDDARLALAEVLRAIGDRDGSTLALRELVARNPAHTEAALRLGLALSDQGRAGEAILMLRRVVEHDPRQESALRELMRLHGQQADVASEATVLGILADLHPQDVEIQRTLAERCLALNRTEAAVTALRRVLSVEPDDLSTLLALAQAEGRLGHGEEAWGVLQEVAGRHADAPGLKDAMSRLCRLQALDAGMLPNQWGQAAIWWERLLAVSPEDSEANDRVARLYEALERWEDLARLYETAYRRHPFHPPTALLLAGALEKAKRPNDAFAILKTALVAHPHDASLRSRAMELALSLELSDEATALVQGRSTGGILSAPERLGLARAKVMEGLLEEAWALIEEILADAELGAEACAFGRDFCRTQAASLDHNPLQALVWWERALRADSHDEVSARTAAILYRQIHRGHDAVRVLRALPDRYKKPELLREFAAACDAAQLFDEGHEAYFALAAREGYTAEGVAHLIELSMGTGKLTRAWEECELLSRVAPDYPKLRLVQGKVSAAIAADHEKRGDYPAAVEWLKRHLKFEPDSPERKRLSAAYLAIGDLNGAVLSYRAWFRRHPTDIEVALWLGKNELAEGLYSEARGYFEAVLDLRPNNLEALEGLATAAVGEGYDDEAFNLYQRIRALRRDYLPASVSLAELAWRKADLAGAWGMLEAVLRENPQHEPAREAARKVLKALADSTTGDLAESWLKRLLELDETDLDVQKALAMNTAARPDVTPGEVAAAFAPILEVEPDDPDARLAELRVAFESGDWLALRLGLEDAGLAAIPEGLYLGAELDLHGDRPEVALAQLEAALVASPSEPRYHLAMADALSRLERWQEAWDHLNEVGEDLGATPRTLELRSKIVWRLADQLPPAESISLLSEFVQSDPDDQEGPLALAERCVELGELEQAIGWLEEIRSADPLHERAVFRLAGLLFQSGNIDHALEVLEPLRDAGNLEALAASARGLLALGQRGRARAEYETLILRSPSHQEGHLALARFACEEANGPLAWDLLRPLLLSYPDDAELRNAALELLIELAERLLPESALEWWTSLVVALPERFEVMATQARLLSAAGRPREAVEVLEPLLARMPHEPDLLALLAECLVAAGEPQRARKLYGIAAQSGDPRAARVLGELSVADQDWAQAASWYARAVLMLPEEPGLRLELARARLAAQDAAGALLALQDLLAISPDHPAAQELMPQALTALGSGLGSAQALSYWRELATRSAADAKVVRSWLDCARSCDDRQDELAALEKLMLLLPEEGTVARELAEARLAAGRFATVRQAIDRALALGEERALLVGAKLALAQGHPRAAASWLARYQDHHPSASDGLWLKVEIAAATRDAEGEWEALAQLLGAGANDVARERALELVRGQIGHGGRSALNWVSRGLALSPAASELPATAVTALGLALLRGKDPEGARSALEWAAAADEPVAILMLARSARRSGDRPQALALYARSLEHAPDDLDVAFERAETLLEDGQIETGAADLEALAKRGADPARARTLLGKAYRRLSETAQGEEALHWLEAWVTADPAALKGWRGLARAAKALGRDEQAEAAYERIVVLDEHDTDGALMLGLAWLASGKAAQAAPLLQRAADAGVYEARLAAVEACVASAAWDEADRQLIAWRLVAPAGPEAQAERMAVAIALARGDLEGLWSALDALEPFNEPQDAPTVRMLRMGRCWEGFERQEEVSHWLERASGLEPAEEDLPGIAHFELGCRLLDSGQVESGRTAMLSAAGRGYPPAALVLARTERSLGRVQEALGWYQAARELQSVEPDLLREHATLLMAVGRDREAFAVLSDLLALGDDEQAELSQQAILRRLVEEEAFGDLAWLAELGERGVTAAWAVHADEAARGRWEEAHAWATRLVELKAPGAVEAAWLAACERARVHPVPAERLVWWRRAVELKPADGTSLRALIHALERQGEASEAMHWSERLIALEPRSVEATRLNTESLLATGRLEEARQVLSGVAEHKDDPILQVLAARLAAAEGKLERAAAILDQVLELHPDHPEARMAQAELLWERGEFRPALELLDQAILRSPTAALKDGAAKRMLELAGRMAEVAGLANPEIGELCRHALQYRPDYPQALLLLANHLNETGRSVEALPHLFALVRLEAAPDHLLKLAETLLAAKRTPEALAILGSLAEETDYPPAWLRLGELELELERPESALELAERLVERAWPGATDLARRAAKVIARRFDPAENPDGAWQAWQTVLRHAADDPDALVGLARASAMRGDVREAVDLLETLLRVREGWPDAKSLLAECYLLQGESQQAEALFHEVLAATPDHAGTLLALARVSQTRGEFVAAGEYAQRVMALGPSADWEKARRLAAYCARQLAEAARLRRDFDQAFLWADLVNAYQPTTFDLLRFNAELARDSGRSGLAASRYRRLLIAFPGSLDEGLQLARCLGNQAVPELERTWNDYRPLAVAHALAMLNLEGQEPEIALSWWRKALEEAPTHPLLLRRAADVCRREDHFEESCGYYKRLVAEQGSDPLLLKTWGATALKADLFEAALEPYEHLAVDHQDPEAVVTMAMIYLRMENLQKAWEWARLALDQGAPGEAASYASQAAHRLAREAEAPEEAILWWQRYLDLVPEDIEGWVDLGQAQELAMALDEAQETYTHARELAPTEIAPGFALAELLRRQGRVNEAVEAYVEVLREHPDHVESLFALAELAWESGERQQVWDLAQRLLALNPRDPRAAELIGRCAQQLAEEAAAIGDWDTAIQHYEQLLAFCPDERMGLEPLCEAYVQGQRLAEAVGLMRERVALDPEDDALRFRHGEIAAMGGFWEEAREVFLALRERTPDNLAVHQALAIIALGLGDAPAAANHYQDALGVAPEDLTSLFGVGRIRLAEGDLAGAWPALEKAVALSPDDPDHADYAAMARTCAEGLAEQANDKQRWDEAIAFRHEVVRLEPDDPEARRLLARTCYEAGRKSEAINELSTLLAANPGDLDSAFMLGEIHRQSGDLEGARRIYQQVIGHSPRHFEARFMLAQIAWDASELEPSWTHLQEAIKARPHDDQALLLQRRLALAFAERAENQGDLAGAIRWWQLAADQEGVDLDLLKTLARAQVQVGALSGAAETYGRVLDADPKDLETAHVLADLHRQRGDLRSAEGPLLRIVALDPRHLLSLRALMLLARERQHAPETLKRAYDMLDVDPENIEAFMQLAWAHEQMMERRSALEACKEVVARSPQHAEAFHTMGRLARDLGDLELAKKAVTSAIYFQPRAPYYHTMGTLYQAFGQIEEALASYGQALVLDPDNADAQADLGLGLLRQAKTDKARPHLQRAFALFAPDSERAIELQCALDLIG